MHTHLFANKRSRYRGLCKASGQGQGSRGQGLKEMGKGRGRGKGKGRGTCKGSLDTSARQKALDRLFTA